MENRVKRHRYVFEEPDIPFAMPVLYEDEKIIVVDKPHFLATMPRGMWYRSTALMRLRELYDEPDIIPAHRLDRSTAGVVVFVRKKEHRRAYQMMFQNHRTEKIYECAAPMKPIHIPQFGTLEKVKSDLKPDFDPDLIGYSGVTSTAFVGQKYLRRSRIVKKRGIIRAMEERGVPNSETLIAVAPPEKQIPDLVKAGFRIYELYPRTGKNHQLRVHMNSIGLPIMNDDFYPNLQAYAYDDFSKPLQLIARTLRFIDPITGADREFISQYSFHVPC